MRSRTVAAFWVMPCPLCDEPLDPEGHICVRTNGYRRSLLEPDDEPDA